jgi:hypothetical protein
MDFIDFPIRECSHKKFLLVRKEKITCLHLSLVRETFSDFCESEISHLKMVFGMSMTTTLMKKSEACVCHKYCGTLTTHSVDTHA